MTTERIYIVTPKASEGDGALAARLVRATHPAQALRHVTAELNVSVASQDDLVRLIADGVKVESAKAAG